MTQEQEHEYLSALRIINNTAYQKLPSQKNLPNWKVDMWFNGIKCTCELGYLVKGYGTFINLKLFNSENEMIWTGPPPNNVNVIEVIVLNNVVKSVMES